MLDLRYSFALFVSVALSTVAAFAAPSPAPVTPQLVDAAKQEGKVVFYTSIELQTAEKIAKAFESAYPGIAVQVERNGCERLFQRLAQERDSNIHSADAVCRAVSWDQSRCKAKQKASSLPARLACR